MKVLLHTLGRTIRTKKKMFFSLIIISAIGISLMTALLNSYQCLSGTFQEYFSDYNYPDVTVLTELPFTDTVRDELTAIDGVENVQLRLALDVNMSRDNEAGISMRCFSADPDDMVRYYEYASYEDEIPTDYLPMAMEACFVELAGYSLGDCFTITCPSGTYQGILTRIVSSPECAVVYRDRYFDYSTDEFGYAFFSYKDIQRLSGISAPYYNQALIYTADDVVPETVENTVNEQNLFDGYSTSYTYETSMQKRIIDGCITPFRILSIILSAIFFSITLLMIYLFMYQFIREEREKTGILMALGVSNAKLLFLYLCLGLCILIPACLLGNIIGYLLTEACTTMYQTSFYLPYMNTHWSPLVTLFSCLLTLFVVEFSVLLASLQIFRYSPAQAMRTGADMSGPSSGGFFKHSSSGNSTLPAVKSLPRIGYVEKVCLSLIARNKGRFALSVLSTTAAIFLIILAFQYQGSINYLIDHTFEERYRYDAQVVFNKPVAIADSGWLTNADGVTGVTMYSTAELPLSFEGSDEDVILYGLPTDDNLIHFYDSAGKEFPLPADGIVLEKKTAERLEISVGNVVSINGYSVPVAGLYEESMIYVAYCSQEIFELLTDSSGYSGAYLTLDSTANRLSLYNAYSKQEDFSYLSMLSSQKNGTVSRLAKLNPVAYIIISAAFLIGFIIIYNMSLINLKEREKIFAIMMAIGVKTSDISKATFAELLIQYLISLLIGSLTGRTLGIRIIQMMKTDILSYPAYFSVGYIVLTAAVVFGFTFFGHLLALKQLYGMNLVERLKSNE